MKNNFEIRTATRSEVDIAVEWAAQEGWNPGLNDADCFYAADPQGFLIGLLNDEPIATISAVQYGTSFGFLGFYIVKPEYRGKGYGIQVWNAALKYLEGRNIGLDGVVEQQPNYRKSGFKLAYRNIRYEGVGGGQHPSHPGIVSLSSLPFEVVEKYDRPFFPEVRRSFLMPWIQLADSTALGLLQEGKLAGYGVIRACRAGHKIGPLFADTPEEAKSLFHALVATVPEGEAVYLDTPEVNEAAVSLAKEHNMNVVFETARMYTGDEPVLPLSRLFGVTTFELG